MNLQEMLAEIQSEGYPAQEARAKACQDIVLKAIAESSVSRNVTIKGGVVMRSLTGNIRRATQDIDIDFIRYSLSDESIDIFIQKINCLQDISIERVGKITELNQQDYHGKSVKILITDKQGASIESKMDLGVHKRLEIMQEEYCFDIAYCSDGASLLINSKEQMFTEKLRSLLKFGSFSTRYKDIFDMYYQCDKLDRDKLKICLGSYIFSDEGMRENNMFDINMRITKVFQNKSYRSKVDDSDKRWIDESIDVIFEKILRFLSSI
jgi:hypothetical protein